MIQIPQCTMRIDPDAFGNVCTHDSNSGRVVSITGCVDCPLADFGIKQPVSHEERSLWQEAKHAAAGAINTAKAYLGIDPATPETMKARWAICSKCEHNDLGRCNLCGCGVSEKLRLASQSCPIMLWVAETSNGSH